MENKDQVIAELFARIDKLMRQQKEFSEEIFRLHQEVRKLRDSTEFPADTAVVKGTPVPENPPAVPAAPFDVAAQPASQPAASSERSKTAWEDFIGANLLNKVGIAILVLGVSFGAKYSIDNQLLDPLTRIVLGYIAGVALTLTALRLKSGHPSFSAVLLSGGMAVFYFITFAAHSFYEFIPREPTFVMMVLFTGFTVFASLRYNMEIISIIGLVGAYAVPFLLSDGAGQVAVLFSYVTIINSGILVLAFKKYWRRLYYLAFLLTWLTFASWFAFSFDDQQHAVISLIFSTVFFLTFYVTFLADKLLGRNASLGKNDIVFMLINAFLFFGFGYITISSQEQEQFLGLFTIGNALVHFVACALIYRTRQERNDVFYFVAGMVLIFLTVAVPVQLEGNWVTLVWAGEAALMFWIGRSRSLSGYERVSYPLIAFAFISLMHDWSERYPEAYFYSYQQIPDFQIFLNIHFLTSLLVAGCFAFILRVSHRISFTGADLRFANWIPSVVSVLMLVTLYTGFFKEIEAYWYNLYAGSRITLEASDGVEYDQYNHYLLSLKNVWLIIFSAIFAAAMSLAVRRWWTFQTPAMASVIFNSLVLLTFITAGLLALGELRTGMFDETLSAYYDTGRGALLMRYVAIASVLPLLWCNRALVSAFFHPDLRKAVHLYLHLVVLTLLSSELIHWLEIARVENSFRLSLSILWGTYALMLVVYGLAKDLKYIRISAMVLFAAIILKLFVYDLARMSTILKTIVMIILGVLLLTASFIYNKFKRPVRNEAP